MCAAEHRRRRCRQGGFSLLEVLVAFTIMAMVLGVIYQLSGSSMRTASRVERQGYAVVMAQSLLARFAQVPVSGVHESGGVPGDLQWQLASAPWPDDNEYGQEIPMHQLSARVYWQERGRTYEVVLTTMLPQAPEGQ